MSPNVVVPSMSQTYASIKSTRGAKRGELSARAGGLAGRSRFGAISWHNPRKDQARAVATAFPTTGAAAKLCSRTLTRRADFSSERTARYSSAAGLTARHGLCYASSAEEPVKILVIGGGGREHALTWALARSPLCASLVCAPGNPGIGAEPKVSCAPALDVDDNSAVVEYCLQEGVGLVVVGPEVPLVAGLADALQAAGVLTFGPSGAAAQLEGSKAFMKDLCRKYNIPSAEYDTFTDPAPAKEFIRKMGAPVVVKADGLAAGKGVVVAMSEAEACEAVDDMLVGNRFGSAGASVVVEEFLEGEEASFFAIVDGETALPLASAQDHKRVGEGDTGPNTGGMGAYSPAPVVTDELAAAIMRDIVEPSVAALKAEGCAFRGCLFAGIMIKDGVPKLLEYNVRFGDPECQVLMSRLQTDLVTVLLAACRGHLDSVALEWDPQTAMVVVMAAEGYPAGYQKGTVIGGLEGAAAVPGVKVFHAGTSAGEGGRVLASGGRVLGVTARGADVKAAARSAYEAVDQLDWPEGFCRRDIGWREIARIDAASPREGAAA